MQTDHDSFFLTGKKSINLKIKTIVRFNVYVDQTRIKQQLYVRWRGYYAVKILLIEIEINHKHSL